MLALSKHIVLNHRAVNFAVEKALPSLARVRSEKRILGMAFGRHIPRRLTGLGSV